MNALKAKSVTVPEIALIAVTRGVIGFGAGLLLANKFKRERTVLAPFVIRFGQHDSEGK